MRRLSLLALLAGLAAVGCGGDEPEARPAGEQTEDTTALQADSDTAALVTDTAAQPARDSIAPDMIIPPGPRAGEASTSAGATSAGEAEPRPRYTVQVGAFTDVGTATALTERLQREGLPVWTAMEEAGGETFYRVRVGAVNTMTAARQLGRLLETKYGQAWWVAPITSSERLPRNAAADTRRALSGG